MEPTYAIEYELTTAQAGEIHRHLLVWELRRAWRRGIPNYAVATVFCVLLIALAFKGWILPVVAGGLLCLVTFFVLIGEFMRMSRARMAVGMALLGLHADDRRVRVEFTEGHVRLETEHFHGRGEWSQLDEVVVFDGFWILRFSNGGQVLLPRSNVSPELEAFIRSKTREVTAPIRQG